jgi:two-component system response regulator WspF
LLNVPGLSRSKLSAQKGIVLVAATNDRLSLRSDFTLHYTKEAIDYPYRPSVNVFFKSLAQYWNHEATAVLYQLR